MPAIESHLDPLAAAASLRSLAVHRSLWDRRLIAYLPPAGVQGNELRNFGSGAPGVLNYGLGIGNAYTVGPYGVAIDTTGSLNSINAGSSPELDNVLPVTYSLWFMSSALSETQILFTKDDIAGAGGVLLVQVSTGGSVTLFRRWSSGNMFRITNAGVITAGTLHHLLVTATTYQTAASTHIYIDGVEPGYAQTTNPGGVERSDAAADLVFGSTLTGFISAIDVWNRVVSAAEIDVLRTSPLASYLTQWPMRRTAPQAPLSEVTAIVRSGAVTGSPPLVAYRAASQTWAFSFIDSAGDAVSVAGHALQLVVEDFSGSDLFVATATGSGSSASFDVTSAEHSAHGLYRYAVRDLTTGAVLARGPYTIRYAP